MAQGRVVSHAPLCLDQKILNAPSFSIYFSSGQFDPFMPKILYNIFHLVFHLVDQFPPYTTNWQRPLSGEHCRSAIENTAVALGGDC